MRVEYSKIFIKKFKKCPAEIKEKFKERLEVFINDRHHPLLNNHSLSGELKGCRSLNINGDWRAIFEELNNGEIAYFVAIGTHSQLYSG
jgi:addiction module RelE/StbE family toxin